MTRISYFALLSLLTVATNLLAQSGYRRGNPTPTDPLYEFYIVDSDDSTSLAPTYHFVDTTYGSWLRMTNWPGTDNSCDTVPITYDSIDFLYFPESIEILQPPHTITLPPPAMPFTTLGCFVSTNGTICLSGPDSSPVNMALPSSLVSQDLIAPLWADWELRTTGDSSKVFVRVTSDSFYISFYNLGLKGTNGQVRATFQVAFATTDSSITFIYKSFDGSFAGVSSAALVQQVATIGLADRLGDAAMYLHKGYYFASSPTPRFNRPLHNQLAIRFSRMVADAFLITNVSMPPNDRYELATNQFSPQCKILNVSDSTIRIFVTTVITNVTTGILSYDKFDSINVNQGTTATYTAPLALGLSCGSYKITFTISYRNNVSDEWAGNNTFTRYFVMLAPQSAPFREEFDEGLNACTWSNAGADARDANTVFRVADAPIATGIGPKAVVMNRLDSSGNPYTSEVGGDTLTTAPIDLSQSSNVYLWFHYQRGLASDSTQAGIFARLHSGPELAVPGALGGMAQVGDSLLVEGLKRSGPEWNPAESDWTTLGVIPGGFDSIVGDAPKLQTFRMLLDTSFLHNHFRVRFRMKARNAESPALYFEDADNFVIDAVHVEPWHRNQTDLEPFGVDLGNGNFTHVPRNLASALIPKVNVRNNGDFVSLGVCLLHLAIRDALNRLVYDQTTLIGFPGTNSDSLYFMPAWNIEGSQGHYFTAYVTLLDNVYEYYPMNDTNIFYQTMNIDNSYALDDGVPDTVSGNAQPPTNFFFDFQPVTPSGNDTLRGLALYFPGTDSASRWTITIVGNGDSVTRTLSIAPTGKGWFTGMFAPYVMPADSTYRIHFVLTSGPNMAGDASNGLVYYTFVDSTTSANNQYGFLHPDILSLFHNSARASYLSPATSVADAGGYLLPMFRLITSGAQNFLPVSLVSLTAARAQDGSGLLQWEMAQEDGLSSFEIEREETGVSAGTLAAESNTDDAHYIFDDPTAPPTPTTYRLIGHMQNGSESILGEVQLGPWNGPSAAFDIAVYPNPTASQVTINAASIMQSVEIIDPLGRTIQAAEPNSPLVTLDLPNLPTGGYWIVAKSGNAIARARIAVVH
jgi:hypothetical protein